MVSIALGRASLDKGGVPKLPRPVRRVERPARMTVAVPLRPKDYKLSIPTLNQLDEDLDPELEPEVDDARGDGDLAEPYDPTLIRVEPKMFSLRNILDMIDEGEVDLAPDFQRLKVWSPRQKSRLIESVLLRIPLPAFYFASDSEGKLQVVDGVQRLSTIHQYVRSSSSFPLVDLEYLSGEIGKSKFSDLKGSVWAKRLNSTQIIANVIDPQTPIPVKFDIFKRINTGGTPLNSQEIRHCMSKDPSRSLLKRMTAMPEFVSATNGSLSKNVRMADREMVLRLIAFTLLGQGRYFHSPGLDSFLNEATLTIDNNADQALIAQYEYHFKRAMVISKRIFGEYAFRKWPHGDSRRYPINRAIFEAVGSILMTNLDEALRPDEEIVENFRSLCSSDYEFLSYVTQSTSSAISVAGRFAKLREAFLS